MPAAHKMTSALFSRTFFIGVLLTCLFYGSLIGWGILNKSTHLDTLEKKLASQSVKINRGDMIVTPDDDHTPHTNTDEESGATEHNQTTQHDTPISKEPLSDVDVQGLDESDAEGNVLPIIRKTDGLTSFQVYKAPFASQGKAVIAIVIDDFGLSANSSTELLDQLPPHTTLLLTPYAQNPKGLKNILKQKGHEFWVKVAFENKNFPLDDPGAKTILSRNTLGTNMNNLKWALSRTSGYAGIASYIDTAFAAATPMVKAISRETLNRGLGFFEINVGAGSTVKDIAVPMKAPYIRNDIIFFDRKWNGQFSQGFELLETIAESKGYAVGVLKPFPSAIDAYRDWYKSMNNSKFSLAPLSAVAFSSNPALKNIDISKLHLQPAHVTPHSEESNHH